MNDSAPYYMQLLINGAILVQSFMYCEFYVLWSPRVMLDTFNNVWLTDGHISDYFVSLDAPYHSYALYVTYVQK